jgi:hypothetical protein
VSVLFALLLVSRVVATSPGARAVVKFFPTNTLWALGYGRLDHSNADLFGGIHTVGGALLLSLAWTALSIVVALSVFTRTERL